MAAYVVLSINLEGIKEVLRLYIGQNESSKYWLGIFNELKNRGLNDILILCADGLTVIKQSIQTAYPDTEYQRCIVHRVRKVIYTTNAIESLNSSYKRLNKQRSVFPTPESLLKALYLATK